MILLIDVGSIRTKALLLSREMGTWSVLCQGSAATTIDETVNDVSVGIDQAVTSLIDEAKNELDLTGVEVCICNSAGGGLQMVVAGVVRSMTAASARRAALGSGAIVIDVISGGNAVRQPERLKRFKQHRPDIILLAGGTEGGNTLQVIGLAETIAAAAVQSRLNDELAPVVFAGNSEVRDEVFAFLEANDEVYLSENIRPELESEQIDMVNEVIQEIYINKVSQNTPGLADYAASRNATVRPCAIGMQKLINTWADEYSINALLMDVGGFTVDSYSSIKYVRKAYRRAINNSTTFATNLSDVVERKVFTSISAASGLTYSAPRLLGKAGIDNLLALSENGNEVELTNACFNRMLKPFDYNQDQYTKPLIQGALRTAFAEHQEIAGKLHGVSITRNMSEALSREFYSGGTLAKWSSIDHILLTGGCFQGLSPTEAVQIANDALQPQGITTLHVDNRNMLSQLGAWFAEQQSEGIKLVCQIAKPLITIIAPLNIEGRKPRELGVIQVTHQSDQQHEYPMMRDRLQLHHTQDDPIVAVVIKPHRGVDFGNGFGSSVIAKLPTTEFGVLIDGRNPLQAGYQYKQVLRDYQVLAGGVADE